MEDIICKPIDPSASGGAVRQPTEANDPTDSGEIRGPFSRYPAVKRPVSGHKANGANEAACSAENSRSSQPIPGGERTDLEVNPNPVSSIETELARVRSAWARYRATNSRDAVYGYLTAVFRVVTRWRRLNCAVKNSRTALRLQAGAAQMKPEPFGIVIFCTADPEIVDAKTRSKWSRVLRYAARAKPASQRLTDFVKSNGGINECARKFARTARSASNTTSITA